MKKLLGILVLGLLLSGCSENKSETNRKQSAIKLSCEIKKVNIIKKFDGTDTDIWYDEKFLKENLNQLLLKYLKRTVLQCGKINNPFY